MFATLFGFKGRLSRAGFVESLIAIVLLDMAVVLIAGAVGEYGLPGAYFAEHPPSPMVGPVLLAVFAVLTLWAVLAVSVKRCHDRSRSGWLVLIALVPVIGWLWLLVDLFLLKGVRGRNRHGLEPHGDPAEPETRWETAAVPEAAAPAVAEHHDAPADAVDHHAPAEADEGPAVAESASAHVEEHPQDTHAPVEAHADAHDVQVHEELADAHPPEHSASGQEAGGPDAHSQSDASDHHDPHDAPEGQGHEEHAEAHGDRHAEEHHAAEHHDDSHHPEAAHA